MALQAEYELEKPLAAKLGVLAGVIIPLLATIYAITLLWHRDVNERDLLLLLGMQLLTGLGITVGFHRMLTHRSFETSAPVRAVLVILGTMAGQGNPIGWASTHIQHHAHSDADGDPHSPLVSLWHAHIGWLFTHVPDTERYGSWLLKDRVLVWIDRTWFMWAALGLAIPLAIGGWSGLLWGGLVRIFLGHHITWSVNSVCHTFGNRPFKTRDASRNNWVVGLLALGEGWHNNHHAFPRSAFHGLRWWQMDMSAYFIRSLEALGLVWNVQRVALSDELKRERATM